MADNYNDIINNPHHISKTRKRMSQSNRAAQFAPFAALAGYDATIDEAARLTETKIELDDKTKEILNMKLSFLKAHIKDRPYVTITYFVPDPKKDGGAYVDYSGNIRVIDEVEQTIIFTDRTTIAIDVICDIQGEFFLNPLFFV